jgi:hypothetical protein
MERKLQFGYPSQEVKVEAFAKLESLPINFRAVGQPELID